MLNLNELGRSGLKRIAKEIKVKGFSTMKKDALMEAIGTAIEEDDEVLATVEVMAEQIAAETPVKVKTSATPSLGIKELTFNGKTQSITKWAEEVGLQRPALYDRINRHGWSVEEALTIPAGGRRKSVKAEIEGQTEIEE
jgi:hypothetical protein